jgi:hypothetical protein
MLRKRVKFAPVATIITGSRLRSPLLGAAFFALAAAMTLPAQTPLQSAITQKCNAGGGVLNITSAYYTQNTPLTLCSNLTLVGEGAYATKIETTLSSGSLFSLAGLSNVVLQGFGISKTGSAGGTAFYLQGTQHSRLQDIIIQGPFSVGVELTTNSSSSTSFNSLDGVSMHAMARNAVGLWLVPATSVLTQTVSNNRIFNVMVGLQPNDGIIGVKVDSPNGIAQVSENVFVNGDWSNNGTTSGSGVVIASSATRNMIFTGCTIESNKTQGVLVGWGNSGVDFLGCIIQGNGPNNTTAQNFTDHSSGNSDVVMSVISGMLPAWSLDLAGAAEFAGLGLNGQSAIANGIQGKPGMTFQVSGSSEMVLNASDVVISQPVLAKRFVATGTALTEANFGLSASWGVGASVTVLPGSDDQRGQFTVTAGSSPSANATVTLRFADGSWQTSPFAQVMRNDQHSPQANPTWEADQQSLIITFPKAPASGVSYTFSYQLIG